MMEFNPERLSLEKVKPTRDDWSHGTLLIIEELLRSSNMDGEVCVTMCRQTGRGCVLWGQINLRTG